METKFEWDTAKAEKNLKKHGVSFEAATHVFDDPFALAEQDRFENGEPRWQTMGLVGSCLLLLVVHTFRDDEKGIEVIRIISARRAEPKERRRYERNRSI